MSNEGSSLGTKMVSGVAWSAAGRVSTRAFQFGVTVILARLLGPKDFGAVGMAVLVSTFVAMFTELGISTAIVQRKDLTQAQLSAAFVVTAVAGLLAWLGAAAAAPVAAQFFGNPQLTPIIVVSTFGLPAGSLGVVQRAVIMKKMDFRGLAVANVGGSLAYGVLSVSLALAGAGVWSLVAGGIALTIGSTVLLWTRSSWRPSLPVDLAGLRPLFSFGGKMLAFSLLTYVRANIDYLIVARFLGPVALGLYTVAFKLADFPRNNVAPTITGVALPAFASVQDDEEKIRRGYAKTLRLLCMASFPILVGLSVVATEFVGTVYGQHWLGAVAPLQALLLMGMLLVASEPATTVLVAKGKAGQQVGLTAAYAFLLGVLILLSVRQGITGVAVAGAAATAAYFISIQRKALPLVRMTAREFLRVLLPICVSCGVMAVALGLYRFSQYRYLRMPGIAWLVSAVALGAVVYTACLSRLDVSELAEGKESARRAARNGWRAVRSVSMKRAARKSGLACRNRRPDELPSQGGRVAYVQETDS